jgi:hypothetical protein
VPASGALQTLTSVLPSPASPMIAPPALRISAAAACCSARTRALQPDDVIFIRSTEGTPTDALLVWGKACAAKVVHCRKCGDQGKTRYGIGVRYHSPKETHDGPHLPGPDGVVAAPIGYVILDNHGKITQINLAFAEMLAYNRLEIVGQPLARFVAIKDWDILHLHRMQVMEANDPHHCELQLQAHDGLERRVEERTKE